MTRPAVGVAFLVTGLSLLLATLVSTALSVLSFTHFTTWALFVHALIFTGVGLRAFIDIVAPPTRSAPDAYLALLVDFGATLALAVAVTIVVVLEEKHDHIFGDGASCARVFSGHFATHFAPFFLYAFFYADETRARERAKARPVDPDRATILVSSAVNLLFLYTLCYDVEAVYGLSRTEVRAPAARRPRVLIPAPPRRLFGPPPGSRSPPA